MVEQLVRHQSRRLQGVSSDSPPTMEGQEGVTMEQPASTNVPVGTVLASGTKEYFTIYTNSLVKLPPAADVSIHPSLEGHVDTPAPPDYGPNDPFWRTSMGQAIAEFRVIRPSPGNPPLGEKEQRRINASLNQACNFSERVERIIPPPVSHYETMSACLPITHTLGLKLKLNLLLMAIQLMVRLLIIHGLKDIIH